MEWLKSKTTIVAGCFLIIAGVEGYALMTMKSDMTDRFGAIENEYAKSDEKLTMLTSDLDVVAKKLGVTTDDLKNAQELAKQLKDENARMRRALTSKADSKLVMDVQKEAATNLDAVHQETTSKIDGINGDVKGVR